MTASPPYRVVEVGGGIAGAVCGRLFAGLGHDVVLCEPPGGIQLRHEAPLNAAGDGLAFVALNADKGSMVADLHTAEGRRNLHQRLDAADVAIIDMLPRLASELELDAERIRDRWPRLVAVSITGFGPTGDYRDLPADSLLAEAYGGLATMIGEEDCRPLSLGGEQTAYCTGVTGFLGAMLALRRRDLGQGGDVVDVAMCDVAAYMDWKSDVGYSMSGVAPKRCGTKSGDWRLVRARDGWVGFIFQPKHWSALVELVGAPELTDPLLADPSARLARADEWWPIVERWAHERPAEEIYRRAQDLGLPFGWAARPSDLVRSAQLRARGFLAPSFAADASTPAVGTPVHTAELPWRSGRAPAVGEVRDAADRPPASEDARSPLWASSGDAGVGPLDGIVVLDFGTITAGAAVTRLMADYGATVLKIEWLDYPDTFRSWKTPSFWADARSVVDHPTSPYFPSNNVGKLGVGINLKQAEGQRLVQHLARCSHVLVENYRVGVGRRLGIDVQSMHRINPDLICVSLSSQGQDGPEARNSSYGSTLDLLSGLASVTGYEPDRPLWSSSDVNYPDQLVSLFGAAFVAYCVQSGITGAHLDMSQREVVSWTLAAEVADYLVHGHDAAPQGNRRVGRAPHDTYPCSEADTWIAVSCFSDQHRQGLATCIRSARLADRDATWWWSHQDLADAELTAWTRARTREQAIVELRAAGVPAVPVLSAADRQHDPRFTARRVTVFDDGVPVKGLPLLMGGYAPSPNLDAPALGADTRAVLRRLCDLSDEVIDDLEARGVIYCGSRSDVATKQS